MDEIDLDFTLALFDGKLIFDAECHQIGSIERPSLTTLVPVNYCWIACCKGDIAYIADKAFANNDLRSRLAALTVDQYDATVNELREKVPFLGVPEHIIVKTIYALLQRLDLVQVLTEYARQEIKYLYYMQNRGASIIKNAEAIC